MQNVQTQGVSPLTKLLIDKLLLGKFTLAEVAQVTGISRQWLESYVHAQSQSNSIMAGSMPKV